MQNSNNNNARDENKQLSEQQGSTGYTSSFWRRKLYDLKQLNMDIENVAEIVGIVLKVVQIVAIVYLSVKLARYLQKKETLGSTLIKEGSKEATKEAIKQTVIFALGKIYSLWT